MCGMPPAFENAAWNSLFYLNLATLMLVPLYPCVASIFPHKASIGVSPNSSCSVSPSLTAPDGINPLPLSASGVDYLNRQWDCLVSLSFLSTHLWVASYFPLSPCLSPFSCNPWHRPLARTTARMSVGWAWSTDVLCMVSSTRWCLAGI